MMFENPSCATHEPPPTPQRRPGQSARGFGHGEVPRPIPEPLTAFVRNDRRPDSRSSCGIAGIASHDLKGLG